MSAFIVAGSQRDDGVSPHGASQACPGLWPVRSQVGWVCSRFGNIFLTKAERRSTLFPNWEQSYGHETAGT